MTTPTIRAAHEHEAAALSDLALRSKASWGYPPSMMEAFEAELTLTVLDLDEVFVLEVDGVRAGFYSLQVLSEARAEVGHLFLEPALRRRGLGRLMITDALRRAAARGLQALEIQGDPNAAAFYVQMGAVRIGERESDSIPGRMLPLFEIAVGRRR